MMTEDDKALVERVAMLPDGNAWPSTMELLCDLRDRIEAQAKTIEALSAENERLRQQLSGISGRLEAMRVALIHTAGICNPLGGFLKNVTGLRKKHLDSVRDIARAELQETEQ